MKGAFRKKMESVSIFVDVQNVYYTTKDAYDCHFDYNKFWQKATQNRKVIKAIAYAINRGDEKQLQFQRVLRGIGFDVKLKPYIQRADGSSKGDWDVGITLDVIELASCSDTIILVSGDGDFDVLATRVRNGYNRHVEVYGVPLLTAKSLVDAASSFIPIDESLLLSNR